MNQKTTQLGATTPRFTVLLSPTRRGARLARLLAATQLREWDVACGVTERAEHVVAELAANAALHGRVPGRDFRLALTTTEDGRVLRIEVTDTRHDHLPGTFPQQPCPDDESGRGLLLVESLSDRWGVIPGPLPRKTVWAELALAPEPDQAPLLPPGAHPHSRE
ncbi:ATP-binding protein [Streptomyces sp. NBC_01142]|uniref:ATP-binding protein n=1 Tax=Streptomyces sp. NBC_01142 TaxID=2975865 RepID=UPI002255F26C|nr:ATP-binding protein [Streptomyces sp. NBC_01142]MCX4818713.1 ATP-binding protein [Streptomyces sp. NBC_01142]